MRIDAFKSRGVHVLAAAGELKLDGGEAELVRACDAAIAAGSRFLVLDFTQLGWMDSAGVAAIVRCASRAGRGGAILKIAVAEGGPVRKILAATHLDRAYEVFDDLGEAVASFPF